MSIDIWTDSMQHAELFGKPVLFTNWLIQRDTIPQGWHCYDLRGTRKAPNARITLVDQEAGYGWSMTSGPTACRRVWMLWQVTFQRQAPTESRTGSQLSLRSMTEVRNSTRCFMMSWD